MGDDPPGIKIESGGSYCLASRSSTRENSRDSGESKEDSRSDEYRFHSSATGTISEEGNASDQSWQLGSPNIRIHSASSSDGLVAVEESDELGDVDANETKKEDDQDADINIFVGTETPNSSTPPTTTGDGNARSRYSDLYGGEDFPRFTASTLLQKGGTHVLSSNPESYLRMSRNIVKDHNANSMLELPLVPAVFAGSYTSQAPGQKQEFQIVAIKKNPKEKSDEDKACAALQMEHRFPRGLAVEAVMASRCLYPLRIWLVDNNKKSCQGYELLDSLTDQIVMAKTIDLSLSLTVLNKEDREEGEFVILSKKGPSLPHDTSVISHTPRRGNPIRSSRVEQKIAEVIQRSKAASHDTPSWSHLVDDLLDRIELSEEDLRQEQQKVLIVLATDNLVLDKRVTRKLKQLSRLPVQLLVRLYRANDPTIGELQHICNKNKLPVTVLGDFEIHHSRVALINPWLNYALPLHRCRELGVESRLICLLDKRLLTEFELREFLMFLFGRAVMMDAPDIHTEWPLFFKFIGKVNSKNERHFSSRTGRGEKWLNLSELSYFYGHPEMRSEESQLAKEDLSCGLKCQEGKVQL